MFARYGLKSLKKSVLREKYQLQLLVDADSLNPAWPEELFCLVVFFSCRGSLSNFNFL